MAIYLEHGNDQLKIPHTPTVDVAGGELVMIGTTACIASLPIAANKPGNVNYPNGSAVYRADKIPGEVFADDADVTYELTKGAAEVGGIKIGKRVGGGASADRYVDFVHER